jgi:hypothetical protein
MDGGFVGGFEVYSQYITEVFAGRGYEEYTGAHASDTERSVEVHCPVLLLLRR